jgi:hypothetical protein
MRPRAWIATWVTTLTVGLSLPWWGLPTVLAAWTAGIVVGLVVEGRMHAHSVSGR